MCYVLENLFAHLTVCIGGDILLRIYYVVEFTYSIVVPLIFRLVDFVPLTIISERNRGMYCI